MNFVEKNPNFASTASVERFNHFSAVIFTGKVFNFRPRAAEEQKTIHLNIVPLKVNEMLRGSCSFLGKATQVEWIKPKLIELIESKSIEWEMMARWWQDVSGVAMATVATLISFIPSVIIIVIAIRSHIGSNGACNKRNCTKNENEWAMTGAAAGAPWQNNDDDANWRPSGEAFNQLVRVNRRVKSNWDETTPGHLKTPPEWFPSSAFLPIWSVWD